MAFKKTNINETIRKTILVLFTVPLVVSSNTDCNGKSFHCVNSTHFMICVDFGGGISSTIDNFIIPCPTSTVCLETNDFECEFPPVTTLAPPIDTSETGVSGPSEITTISEASIFAATTNPELVSELPLTERNTVSITTLQTQDVQTTSFVTPITDSTTPTVTDFKVTTENLIIKENENNTNNNEFITYDSITINTTVSDISSTMTFTTEIYLSDTTFDTSSASQTVTTENVLDILITKQNDISTQALPTEMPTTIVAENNAITDTNPTIMAEEILIDNYAIKQKITETFFNKESTSTRTDYYNSERIFTDKPDVSTATTSENYNFKQNLTEVPLSEISKVSVIENVTIIHDSNLTYPTEISVQAITENNINIQDFTEATPIVKPAATIIDNSYTIKDMTESPTTEMFTITTIDNNTTKDLSETSSGMFLDSHTIKYDLATGQTDKAAVAPIGNNNSDIPNVTSASPTKISASTILNNFTSDKNFAHISTTEMASVTNTVNYMNKQDVTEVSRTEMPAVTNIDNTITNNSFGAPAGLSTPTVVKNNGGDFTVATTETSATTIVTSYITKPIFNEASYKEESVKAITSNTDTRFEFTETPAEILTVTTVDYGTPTVQQDSNIRQDLPVTVSTDEYLTNNNIIMKDNTEAFPSEMSEVTVNANYYATIPEFTETTIPTEASPVIGSFKSNQNFTAELPIEISAVTVTPSNTARKEFVDETMSTQTTPNDIHTAGQDLTNLTGLSVATISGNDIYRQDFIAPTDKSVVTLTDNDIIIKDYTEASLSEMPAVTADTNFSATIPEFTETTIPTEASTIIGSLNTNQDFTARLPIEIPAVTVASSKSARKEFFNETPSTQITTTTPNDIHTTEQVLTASHSAELSAATISEKELYRQDFSALTDKSVAAITNNDIIMKDYTESSPSEMSAIPVNTNYYATIPEFTEKTIPTQSSAVIGSHNTIQNFTSGFPIEIPAVTISSSIGTRKEFAADSPSIQITTTMPNDVYTTGQDLATTLSTRSSAAAISYNEMQRQDLTEAPPTQVSTVSIISNAEIRPDSTKTIILTDIPAATINGDYNIKQTHAEVLPTEISGVSITSNNVGRKEFSEVLVTQTTDNNYNHTTGEDFTTTLPIEISAATISAKNMYKQNFTEPSPIQMSAVEIVTNSNTRPDITETSIPIENSAATIITDFNKHTFNKELSTKTSAVFITSDNLTIKKIDETPSTQTLAATFNDNQTTGLDLPATFPTIISVASPSENDMYRQDFTEASPTQIPEIRTTTNPDITPVFTETSTLTETSGTTMIGEYDTKATFTKALPAIISVVSITSDNIARKEFAETISPQVTTPTPVGNFAIRQDFAAKLPKEISATVSSDNIYRQDFTEAFTPTEMSASKTIDNHNTIQYISAKTSDVATNDESSSKNATRKDIIGTRPIVMSAISTTDITEAPSTVISSSKTIVKKNSVNDIITIQNENIGNTITDEMLTSEDKKKSDSSTSNLTTVENLSTIFKPVSTAPDDQMTMEDNKNLLHILGLPQRSTTDFAHSQSTRKPTALNINEDTKILPRNGIERGSISSSTDRQTITTLNSEIISSPKPRVTHNRSPSSDKISGTNDYRIESQDGIHTPQVEDKLINNNANIVTEQAREPNNQYKTTTSILVTRDLFNSTAITSNNALTPVNKDTSGLQYETQMLALRTKTREAFPSKTDITQIDDGSIDRSETNPFIQTTTITSSPYDVSITPSNEKLAIKPDVIVNEHIAITERILHNAMKNYATFTAEIKDLDGPVFTTAHPNTGTVNKITKTIAENLEAYNQVQRESSQINNTFVSEQTRVVELGNNLKDIPSTKQKYATTNSGLTTLDRRGKDEIVIENKNKEMNSNNLNDNKLNVETNTETQQQHPNRPLEPTSTSGATQKIIGTPRPKIAHNESTFAKNVNGVNPLLSYCLNRNRGKYSDSSDCTKFYICIGRNLPIVGKCPSNTVFSDFKKQCTNNKSHCVRGNEFRCTAEGRFRDLLKNNIYYICVKRINTFTRFQFQCQIGYYLNDTTIRCIKEEILDHQSISVDKNSEISSSDSKNSNETNLGNTEKELKEIEKDVKVDFVCNKEGKFAHPSNCKKYYVCTKRKNSEFRRKRKSCNSGERFHKDKRKCVDADSYEC